MVRPMPCGIWYDEAIGKSAGTTTPSNFHADPCLGCAQTKKKIKAVEMGDFDHENMVYRNVKWTLRRASLPPSRAAQEDRLTNSSHADLHHRRPEQL